MVRRLVPAVLAVTACSGSLAAPFRPVPGDEPPATEKIIPAGKAIGQLPYARGRSFATLDDYLAFRQQQGAIDLPWYKEVAPGLFELQTSLRPVARPERFTRAELARKYGFDEKQDVAGSAKASLRHGVPPIRRP